MTHALRFTVQDWERIGDDWTAWWAGELDRPLVVIENPVFTRLPEELSIDFLLKKPVEEVLDYNQSNLEAKQIFGDAWPKWLPFFGAGVVAAFLGSGLHCSPEAETIWFESVDSFITDTKPLTSDPNNIWWRRVKSLTEAAVDYWDDRVCIGFTDLGGNLDILASLQTSQTLLMDLSANPDSVTQINSEIASHWMHYYEELFSIIQKTGRGTTPWAPIWAPGRCYMLQSDFSAMISPQMFETFVLPTLAVCCDEIDFTFYHLDGKGQINHLDLLLSLERLHGIQWIPGAGQPPPVSWLPLLKRIIDAGKLCQLYVSAEDARTIVRELGGRGFAFYITDTIRPDEADPFFRSLISDNNMH
jgi:5-methyltetrahydrofolate--homocysteine methyltransferase